MLLLADLSSQAAVRSLAADVRREVPRIDVLINNAGAAFPRRGLSADGIEMTLATDHLAPFLLTNLLLDRVRTAAQGRIVNGTGEIHGGAIDFDDLQSGRRYHFLRAYALSKLGNVLFTYELARRLAGTDRPFARAGRADRHLPRFVAGGGWSDGRILPPLARAALEADHLRRGRRGADVGRQ